MESLKEKLQSPAFMMFVLYFFTALLLVIFLEKGTFLLWLNSRHNPFGNVFFRYVTHFGEGLVFVLVGIIFLFYRFYNLILLVMVGFFQYILVYLAKALIFNFPRPSIFYEGKEIVFNLVEGVKMEARYSFPSGHTATAFALATLLICLTRNKLLQVLYMLGAILVAISRIYLFQHFLVDTLVGALAGMFTAGLIWWYFTQKNPDLLYHKSSLQRGLLKS
ncbi:phosphatase PAP2 family protein [Marivirga sp. S37H4]|uniref:Phosphatase PAP2 family protein n=1 Tax=Marivirga aurantiaca TaxID=2802615 RepID=A0A935C688_9BACT|nr:phosphatase PAP2 family protein [Marivirga aurantiaca]MBK6264235.1 phosphatase PAP2 family protein [Marivirga aurantiaca]